MKILTLMENTEGACGLENEHGLSFYIETEKHHLLLDTGSSDKTWKNAEKLGVDLSSVDTVILSHGHYDHTGGVMEFAKINPKAVIYMQRKAGGEYYSAKTGTDQYIGIDKLILDLPELVLLDGDAKIDAELEIFTGITGRRKWPQSNLLLHRLEHGEFVQDIFDHEECLVICQGQKKVLLSGCAHNGILNILDRFREIYGQDPDLVISGFHMMKKTDYTEEEIQTIRETAKELTGLSTKFYTGHCTGIPAYNIMKEIMGEQLQYAHPGTEILL